MGTGLILRKPDGFVSKPPGNSALTFQEQRVNGPGTDPLLLGLAAGDERAFAALYDRFAARMYRTALRMLGRREDAEDAVQDVFLAAVRSRERLGNLRDLTAYLFAALHRAAGRFALRRARRFAYRPRRLTKRLRRRSRPRRTARTGFGCNRRFARCPTSSVRS